MCVVVYCQPMVRWSASKVAQPTFAAQPRRAKGRSGKRKLGNLTVKNVGKSPLKLGSGVMLAIKCWPRNRVRRIRGSKQ